MNINNFFNIDERLMQLDEKILAEISPRFKETDDITEYNQLKMLSAFIKNGVTESAFAGSTGYGYDDRGREILERVMADAMGAEDSLIRHNFVSGTHTLTVAGDKVLVLTGRPYDTITGVFGIDEKTDGSLADFGVEYHEIALLPDGTPDKAAIKKELAANAYKMAYIQRSRGYSTRPSLTIEKIRELCDIVREVSPQSIIMVDNCYGEFTESRARLARILLPARLLKTPAAELPPRADILQAGTSL